jgi:hypothetical protein
LDVAVEWTVAQHILVAGKLLFLHELDANLCVAHSAFIRHHVGMRYDDEPQRT